jgi:hypothetical protein
MIMAKVMSIAAAMGIMELLSTFHLVNRLPLSPLCVRPKCMIRLYMKPLRVIHLSVLNL